MGAPASSGRLGGDEFAVLLYENMPLVELEVELRHLLEQVGKVSWDGYRLSCSIGVLPIRSLYAPEELYGTQTGCSTPPRRAVETSM